MEQKENPTADASKIHSTIESKLGLLLSRINDANSEQNKIMFSLSGCESPERVACETYNVNTALEEAISSIELLLQNQHDTLEIIDHRLGKISL